MDQLKKFWKYLKKDTWDSWLVSLVLVFILIKFLVFPALSLGFGTPLPLVVVESCSMYHSTGFEKWWEQNGAWYEVNGLDKEDFENFPFKNGINKGDIVVVWGHVKPEVGDVIIFQSSFKYPVIHRLVNDLETKGDNNPGQLEEEREIREEDVLGKAVFRVPALGWLKLVFFEGLKAKDQRGLCR